MNVAIGNAGNIEVLLSENNGLDWKPLAEVIHSGDQRIDLKPHVFCRYDYQLKFVLSGSGSGIDEL
ncbi:MAG TPA: hypothetical protein VF614_07100, partial [Chthoniobacteraceae bacterium]